MVPELGRGLLFEWDRSRNVGDEDEDAQELKLVDGVRPKISWTVGL